MRHLIALLALAVSVLGTGCSDLLTPEKVREHLAAPTAPASASTMPRTARDFFSAQRASGARSLAFFAKGFAGSGDDGTEDIAAAFAIADRSINRAGEVGVGDVWCAGNFAASLVGFDGCDVGGDCDASLTLDSCLLRTGGDEHASGKIIFSLKSQSASTLGENYARAELRLTFEDFEITEGDETRYFDGVLAIETTEYTDDADNVEVVVAADVVNQRRRIERGWFDDGRIESHRATAGLRFTAREDDDSASVTVELLAFVDEDDGRREESIALTFGANAEEVSEDQTLANATLAVTGSNGSFECTWNGASEGTADRDGVYEVQSAGTCVDDDGETFSFSGTASGR